MRILQEARTVEQTIHDFGDKLPQETIEKIIKLDPTSRYDAGKTGNYTEWMILKAIKG